MAVKQILLRSAGILLIGTLVSLPLAVLERSAIAAPLAIGMNVSEPLIRLNELVQGIPADSYRYRRDASLEIGWEHIERDGSILAAVVTGTVLAQGLWKRHRKLARNRARHADEALRQLQ